jgi:hypothetical protein
VVAVGKTLTIQIEVADDTSDEALLLTEQVAREAAVLFLQQEGEISIREAAASLSLTYERYLDLLTAKGLPATADCTDPALLEDLLHQIEARRKLPV